MHKFRFWTGNEITKLNENQIFVFGSNPEGRHGAGAAKDALAFGAQKGNGRGLQGQSYALVTKNLKAGFYEKSTGITYASDSYKSVTEEQIRDNIKEMYDVARSNPNLMFIITYKNDSWPNGSPKKSLNGYNSHEMFHMLTEGQDMPPNIIFHDSFKPLAKLFLEKQSTQQSQPEPTPEALDLVNPDDYTFFWHTTSPYSQWHPSIFVYKDITFTSAEQFMMYSKAKLFKDEVQAAKIMEFNNSDIVQDFLRGKVNSSEIMNSKNLREEWSEIQKRIKRCGKDVQNYVEEVWVEKRIPIVTVGTREKFKQNAHLTKNILETIGTTLVEASPLDPVWGIGLDKANALKTPKDKWPGTDYLGKILTTYRLGLEAEMKNAKVSRPKI